MTSYILNCYELTIHAFRRGTLSAYVSSMQLLGPVIAPIIGGAVTEQLDWR